MELSATLFNSARPLGCTAAAMAAPAVIHGTTVIAATVDEVDDGWWPNERHEGDPMTPAASPRTVVTVAGHMTQQHQHHRRAQSTTALSPIASTASARPAPPSSSAFTFTSQPSSLSSRSRSSRQVLLMFKGHCGVGKSTLARAVSHQLQWPLISKDDIRDHTSSWDIYCNQQLLYTAATATATTLGSTSNGSVDTRITDTIPQLDSNRLCYEVMWTMARTQLKCGLPGVIVECPLAREVLYQRGCQLAHECGALAIVIDCWLDGTTWSARVNQRGWDHRTAKTVASLNRHQQPGYSHHPSNNSSNGEEKTHEQEADDDGDDGLWSDDDERDRPEPASPFVGITSRTILSAPPSLPSSSSVPLTVEPPSLSSASLPTRMLTQDESVARNVLHKPQTWSALRTLLSRYNGCYRYELHATPNLSLNMAAPVHVLRDRVCHFVTTIMQSTPMTNTDTIESSVAAAVTSSPTASTAAHVRWYRRWYHRLIHMLWMTRSTSSSSSSSSFRRRRFLVLGVLFSIVFLLWRLFHMRFHGLHMHSWHLANWMRLIATLRHWLLLK